MSELLLTALRQSTPQEKGFALAELLREHLRAHGGGPCVIRDVRDHAVGYVISEPDADPPPDYRSSFPRPGTAEWAAMNVLRQNLIRRSIRGELTADERPLYELLQAGSLAAVEIAFPVRPV